jgi:hypothetical protein
MGHRQEAAILAFPAGRAATRPSADGGARRGSVVALRPADESHDGDFAFSATWDEMSKLADDAWSWRDPESLARLEACVERLWSDVERDWGPRGEREASTRTRRARRYFTGFVALLSSLLSGVAARLADFSATTQL